MNIYQLTKNCRGKQKNDGTVVRGGDGGLVVVHGHGVLRNNEQQQHNRV